MHATLGAQRKIDVSCCFARPPCYIFSLRPCRPLDRALLTITTMLSSPVGRWRRASSTSLLSSTSSFVYTKSPYIIQEVFFDDDNLQGQEEEFWEEEDHGWSFEGKFSGVAYKIQIPSSRFFCVPPFAADDEAGGGKWRKEGRGSK